MATISARQSGRTLRRRSCGPARATSAKESLRSSRSKQVNTIVVLPHGTYPRYVASGHLLYVENDTIFARRFDLTTLTSVGPSVSVLPNVDAGAAGQKPFDISASGTVVYVPGSPDSPQPLFMLDATGAATRQLPFAAARFRQFRVSPDGRRLAVGGVRRRRHRRLGVRSR